MNSVDIFKNLGLGSMTSSMSQSTPQTAKSQFVSSLVPSTGTTSSRFYPTPTGQLPAVTSGGNNSATAPLNPKTNYINSQTGDTGSTVSSTGNFTTPSGAVVNSGGGLVSGPTSGAGANSQPLNDYTSAFNTYLQSLQPTDAETSAEKALADQQLQASKNQDYALEKPGQTLAFASGEAARVARNDAYQTDALANSVNAFTNSRTARTTASKAQLDFEKGLYDDYTTANKPKDYTNVSPGSTVFDPNTGKAIYTAPTAASQNPGPLSGSYIAGTDPTADGWVTAINNGQAKLTDVPAAYKSLVAQGLATAGKDDALKTNALTSAQQLLTTFTNSHGILGTPLGSATSAVGFGGNLPAIPGTQAADFVANLDNLKSLLSLDNVKYLKGQGAVSDAERKLLADSATQLSRSQSEGQFKATLQKIIDGLTKFGSLGGSSSSGGGDQPQSFQLPDGTVVHLQADGTYQ